MPRVKSLGPLIALLSLVAVAVVGVALQPRPRSVDSHRLPFLPVLAVNELPGLCLPIHRQVLKDFVGNGQLTLGLTAWRVPFDKDDNEDRDGQRRYPLTVTADLFGNGKPVRIAIWPRDFRVFQYAEAFVFRDPGRWIADRENIVLSPESKELGFWLPDHDDRYTSGGLFPLIRYQGRVYVGTAWPGTYGLPELESLPEVDGKFEVKAIDSDGRPRVVCAIQLRPVDGPGLEARSPIGPAFDRLVNTMPVIWGDAMCGWCLFEWSTRQSVAATIERLSFRPWTIRPLAETHAHLLVSLQFLNEWARQDPWAYDVTLRIKDGILPALAEAREYLKTVQHMPADMADRIARQVVEWIVAVHIVMPENTPSANQADATSLEDAVRNMLRADALIGRLAYDTLANWPAIQTGELRRQALLFGMTPAMLERLRPYKPPTEDAPEPDIAWAVRWPHLIKYLAERDPGQIKARNWFGKTALMYAAHFNLLASVEVLLAQGAEVNEVTWPNERIRPTPRRDASGIGTTGRSGLMYAAENADLALIQLLLRHGADKQIRDSNGRKALDYLAGNLRLTPQELAQAKVLLQ